MKQMEKSECRGLRERDKWEGGTKGTDENERKERDRKTERGRERERKRERDTGGVRERESPLQSDREKSLVLKR